MASRRKSVRAGSKAKLSASSLIAAARKGDVSKLRECISQGVNINGIAGGVAPNCALGGAAEKGRYQAIELLLEAGADPNNPLLPKHALYPLDWAVFGGSTECARLLLESGADVNRPGWDDKTALDAAKTDNNRPMIELLIRYKAKTEGEIGKHIPAKPAPVVTNEDDETPVVNLASLASNPVFSESVAKVARASGVAAQTIENIRGGYSFSMPAQQADKVLANNFQEARDAGFLLFRATSSSSEGDHRLVLLPTLDYSNAVRGMQTNGANADVMPSDIIRWLRALEKWQPFVLDGIGYDFVEGQFTSELKDVQRLAKEIYEFCPDVVDQGTETVRRLAAELERTKRLFLWWD